MQVRQVNKPTRLLRDIAEKYITPDGAFYLLNHDVSVNDEAKLQSASPLPANELLCEFETYGDAYNVGRYKSPVTNEVYGFNIVPAGVNFIFRINPDGTCEVVYEGACLPLSAEPKHEITQLRCYLKVDKLCAHRHGKELVWVDGSDNPIGMLDVEASIATNSFTTPFFDLCPDECAPIQMCVPEICGALRGQFEPRNEVDINLSNQLSDKGIQVACRHIYYDERASEISDFSTLIYLESGSCYNSDTALSRCVRFRVPVGNPLVDKIEIYFRVNNGQQWFLYETIEKYQPYINSQQYWYERELADLLNFSENDCAFDYIFCNDKECVPVNPVETSRVFNPMPREAQGFFRIKDSLAFFNYLKGNCPISKTETDKFKLAIDCVTVDDCPLGTATVTVRAIIHRVQGKTKFIYRLGGDDQNVPDDYSDTAYFGGSAPSNPVSSNNSITWGQEFPNNTQVRNFIGYIEGTDIWGEFRQWKSDAYFTNRSEIGIIQGMNIQSIKNFWATFTDSGFMYQELKLRVPKGSKGFIRLVSHEMTDGFRKSQNTSEAVLGILQDITTYNGGVNITAQNISYNDKEIYFDTCDGDFETNKAFVIRDNASIGSISPFGEINYAAYTGYLKDALGFPVEGLKIDRQINVTDHNGFYSFYHGNADPSHVVMDVDGEQDCISFTTIQSFDLYGVVNQTTKTDRDIISTDYRDNFYKVIKIKVVDCDGVPVIGVVVAISGSKSRTTDEFGVAEFRIRNYVERSRSVRVIVMRNYGCFSKDCAGECDYCIDITESVTSACYSPVTTITLPDATLSKFDNENVSIRAGLKAGGRYPFGTVIKGSCGRMSAVYPVSITNRVPYNVNKGLHWQDAHTFLVFNNPFIVAVGDIMIVTNSTAPVANGTYHVTGVSILGPSTLVTVTETITPFGFSADDIFPSDIEIIAPLKTGFTYLDVPRTQEKGELTFCLLRYDATGMVLPDWAECVSVVRGLNINPFELQWVVDKIERQNGLIRITIQSLNDYNASYNFKTNTIYQYLKGDRVEFINNGDGNIFSISTFGLLNFPILSPFHDKIISGQDDAPADYFNQILIEDDGSLSTLTVGAKIELQRPKDCVEENTEYYEVFSIPIVELSGQKVLQYPIGSFRTFDTYFVKRQPGDSVLQLFEHKTPTDFWGGDGVSDVGKVHFINRYENEKREGRGLTVNTQNQFNRFGDFEKILDAPEQGDLTGVGTYDGKIGLGVGEYDSFLFQISNEFLQVGRDNIVRAAPVDSLISDTSPKVSGIFGCQYEDIGSLYFGDGFVTWYDTSKGAFVKHDFNIAKDVSAGKMQSYFREKVQRMKLLNSISGYDIDKYRFVTGFNFHTNVLQFTMKKLTDVAINNSQDALLLMNETVLFEPKSEQFLTYAGYTPEGYSNIEISDAKGCAFLSIYKGNVYRHPIIPDKYNEFFGVACDWIIGVVINDKTEAIKLPMSIEEQSEQMFFVSKVTTDSSTFESEIPAIRFKKTENKWNASFLFDKNSRGGLYGTDKRVAGKPARGYFIKTTFVRDNTDNLKYGTIDNAKRTAPGKLDMILFKYIKSEQSGFESNV